LQGSLALVTACTHVHCNLALKQYKLVSGLSANQRFGLACLQSASYSQIMPHLLLC